MSVRGIFAHDFPENYRFFIIFLYFNTGIKFYQYRLCDNYLFFFPQAGQPDNIFSGNQNRPLRP